MRNCNPILRVENLLRNWKLQIQQQNKRTKNGFSN